MAGILRCAKHDNGVCLPRFIAICLTANKPEDRCHPNQNCRNDRHDETQPNSRPRDTRHQCQRICEISSAGIAPSRMICHCVRSPLRSTIVVGVSRSVGPPLTMIEMRSPIWSRTHSAVVHSEAPSRFSDVAVMGNPISRIMATGIAADGTRSATFPVLAPTFHPPRELAFPMITNGPGQYLSPRSWQQPP